MAKKPKLVELVQDIPEPDVGSTPSGLGEHGLRMWATVVREYQVRDAGGRLLLEEIAHAADTVARLRAQVDIDGLMVQMPAGLRTHPAVRVALNYMCFISSGLKRLGVLDEPVAQPGGPSKRYGPF